MEDNLEKQVADEDKPKKKKRLEDPEPENIENTKINFKNGITVYEGKMTFMIVGAIVTLIFCLTMYYFREDISANLTTLATTFILCIAGVSTAEQAIDMFKNGEFNSRGNRK